MISTISILLQLLSVYKFSIISCGRKQKTELGPFVLLTHPIVHTYISKSVAILDTIIMTMKCD